MSRSICRAAWRCRQPRSMPHWRVSWPHQFGSSTTPSGCERIQGAERQRGRDVVTCNRVMNLLFYKYLQITRNQWYIDTLARDKNHPTEHPNDHPTKSKQSAPAIATPLKTKKHMGLQDWGRRGHLERPKRKKMGVWGDFAGLPGFPEVRT